MSAARARDASWPARWSCCYGAASESVQSELEAHLAELTAHLKTTTSQEKCMCMNRQQWEQMHVLLEAREGAEERCFAPYPFETLLEDLANRTDAMEQHTCALDVEAEAKAEVGLSSEGCRLSLR